MARRAASSQPYHLNSRSAHLLTRESCCRRVYILTTVTALAAVIVACALAFASGRDAAVGLLRAFDPSSSTFYVSKALLWASLNLLAAAACVRWACLVIGAPVIASASTATVSPPSCTMTQSQPDEEESPCDSDSEDGDVAYAHVRAGAATSQLCTATEAVAVKRMSVRGLPGRVCIGSATAMLYVALTTGLVSAALALPVLGPLLGGSLICARLALLPLVVGYRIAAISTRWTFAFYRFIFKGIMRAAHAMLSPLRWAAAAAMRSARQSPGGRFLQHTAAVVEWRCHQGQQHVQRMRQVPPASVAHIAVSFALRLLAGQRAHDAVMVHIKSIHATAFAAYARLMWSVKVGIAIWRFPSVFWGRATGYHTSIRSAVKRLPSVAWSRVIALVTALGRSASRHAAPLVQLVKWKRAQLRIGASNIWFAASSRVLPIATAISQHPAAKQLRKVSYALHAALWHPLVQDATLGSAAALLTMCATRSMFNAVTWTCSAVTSDVDTCAKLVDASGDAVVLGMGSARIVMSLLLATMPALALYSKSVRK